MKLANYVKDFLRDEEGAQIVEYALIIAVISIVLILAMQVLATTDFATWITRVGACLKGSACV